MLRWGCVSLALAWLAAAAPARAQAELSGDVTLASAYMWRGLTVVNLPVLQPSLALSAPLGLATVTGTLWSNIELGKYDGSSDISESGGTSAFNVAELDPSLEVSLPIGEHTVAVGVDGFLYVNGAGYTADDNAAEIFARIDLALPGAPSLGFWRDVTQIDGSYLEASFSHSFALTETVSLDLWSAAGWSISQGENLRSDGSVRTPGNFSGDGFTHWEGTAGLSFEWRGVAIAPWLGLIVANDPWVAYSSATKTRDLKVWAAISIGRGLWAAK